MNRQSSSRAWHVEFRASRCLADPACVWPAAAAGLCVHHYRMLHEPAAASGALPGPASRSPLEPLPPRGPGAASAALGPSPFAELNALLALERPQPAGSGRQCRNPNCGTQLGASNRSGLCKQCSNRLRAFNVRRGRRGASQRLSFEQYLAARPGLRM